MAAQSPQQDVPQWDLSDLFKGMDDPAIEQSLGEQMNRAVEFETRFHGQITSPDLDVETLHAALANYESISREMSKPIVYATLLHTTNTADPARGAFVAKMQEQYTAINLHLLSFELELVKADEDHIQELLKDPRLANYRHYVTVTRKFRPHTLSDPEERIIQELNPTGPAAWSRLFEEVTSNIPFPYELHGEQKTLNQSQILNLMRDPNREVREAAAHGLSAGLAANARILTFVFNNLIQNKRVMDRLRHYEYPEASRHLSNELDRETVEVVVETCVRNYPLVARYYDLKRQILGLPELMHYDRYAPLFESEQTVEWPEAQRLVLECFAEFSPVMRDTASQFFERQWIDARVVPGKRGGAYCMPVTPDLHPYVMTNFLGKFDDVSTLAHELGHGIHFALARGQSYVNFHSTLPLAELASTFGEMLVFDRLQGMAEPKQRLEMYADKIEGSFATIFRQAAMFRFEQAIHNHRREQGELTREQFGDYWQANQQAMFGQSVTLGEEHRDWWMYVSHFIGSPFYVYAYSFGELLVMALYHQYKTQPKGFAQRYLDMLRAGGSLSPEALLSTVGIDIHDPTFWQGGIDVLGGLVETFEQLYRQQQAIHE